MPRILITVVHTIVVTVANVNAGNAVAVVAGEQVAEAGAALTLAVLWGLVGPVTAVVVSITVPCRRDAAVVRTPIRKTVHDYKFTMTVNVYSVRRGCSLFDLGF